jgi:Type IV secretion system pilin
MQVHSLAKTTKNYFAMCCGAGTIAALFIAPHAAFAYTYSHRANTNVWNPSTLAGPLLVCGGDPVLKDANGNVIRDAQGNALPNPNACHNICDVFEQIANIVYFTIAVVIWIITPLVIAIGGIFIMLGGANPGMIERGKNSITGAVRGLVIVLCAWLLVKMVVSPVTGLGISGIGGFSSSSLDSTSAACNL